MLTRTTLMGVGSLVLVAAAAWLAGWLRLAWSMLLGGGWMLANLWVLESVCDSVFCDRARRRWWRLAGPLVVKCPVLYGAGYLAVTAWRPSAAGLAIGVTLVLAALLVGAIQQEPVAG